MAEVEPLEQDLQDVLYGLRSSINYSIDRTSSLCGRISRNMEEVEADLDRVQSEIGELVRSIEQVGEVCARSSSELIDSGISEDAIEHKKRLGQLERLMRLKGQFEERALHLREQKKTLQDDRYRALEALNEAEDILNRLRFSRELIFSRPANRGSVLSDPALSLASHTIRFAERERLILARELHDGPVQLFSAAILLMELVEKLLSLGETRRATSEVAGIREQMKDSLCDIRSFLWHLNPQALEGGLREGLQKLIEKFHDRSDASLELDFSGSDRSVDAIKAVNVFRIVQEAINNALKHGKADRIRVEITARHEELSGRIEDDGYGFEVQTARQCSREQGSFGIANMEERAKLIGGSLSLDSRPGEGTVVSFRVPLDGGVQREED